MKAILLFFSLLIAVSRSPAVEPNFTAFKGRDQKADSIVKILNQLILTDLKIKKMDLGDAVSILQKHNDPQIAVINFVIRNPKGAPASKTKVTLISPKISFAKAIDTLCQKSGYRWSIDFDEQKNPLLVIAPE